MLEITIRRGTAADMPFFQEMEFDTTWTSMSDDERERVGEQAVREALAVTHEILLARAGNVLFVAESPAGERVGLLWFGENRNLVSGEAEGWIYNVSVLPGQRSKGVGARLLSHAEEHAREAGYPALGLMVSVHNQAARRLYDRIGFTTTNLVMRRKLAE